MSSQRSAIIFRLFVVLGLLAGLITVQPVGVAQAATITVTSTSDALPAVSGNCPHATDCRLRDAIAAATAGDTINFSVTGSINLAGELVIDKDLTITGPGVADLTLSAGNANYHIFHIEASSGFVTVLVSGLTVASGAPTAENGGGLFVNAAHMTLNNVIVQNNTAPVGGGIYVGSSSDNQLTLSNSTITSNNTAAAAAGASSGDGAGVYMAAGSLTVTDSMINQNRVGNGGNGTNGSNGTTGTSGSPTGTTGTAGTVGGNGGHGGGFYLGAGVTSATITRSTIRDNWTGMGGDGGQGGNGGDGWSANDGVCPVESGGDGGDGAAGAAGGQAGSGGGIYSLAPLAITDTSILNNTAYSGGRGGYGGNGGSGGTGDNAFYAGCNGASDLGGNGGAGGDGNLGGPGGLGGSGAGIYNAYTGAWSITGSTLAGNQVATAGGGGAGGSGGMGGQAGQSASGVGGNGGNGGNGALNGAAASNGYGAGLLDLGQLILKNSTISGNFINPNNGSAFAGQGGSGRDGGNGGGGGGNGGNGGNGADCNPGGDAGHGAGLANLGTGAVRLENLTLVDNTVNVPASCTLVFSNHGTGGAGGLDWGGLDRDGTPGTDGTGGVDGPPAAVGSAGLYAESRPVGLIRVRNSILNNPDADTANGNCTVGGVSNNPITDGGYNLVGDAADLSCGFTDNLQTGAPVLAAFANNGAHTETRLPGTGSTAIDTGSCLDLDGNSITSEQRAEVPRPFGLTCDIGAVETGIFVWLGGSTGWNAFWNWSGGVVPGTTDTALFNVTSSTNADLYSAASIGRIIVTSGYGGAFNLYDTLTINGDFAPASGNINLGATGILDINGDFTPSGGSVDLGGGGLLMLSGDFTRSGGTFNANTGQVQFDGTGAQSLSGNLTHFYDLRVNKASGTLTLGASMGITNQLRLASGTFDLGAYHADRPVAGGGAMVLDSGTTLQVGGANNFPANYSTYTINTNSTVEYDAAGEQTVANIGGGAPYGHLVISGTLTKTLAGETQVGGTLTVTNATLAAGNNDLWVTGGWVSDGPFEPGTGTVHADGAIAISGNTNPDFHHLVVEPGGDLTLPAGDTHINGNFTNWSNFDGGTGTLIFDSGGTQNLTLYFVASFNNLTVETGTLLVETETADNAALNGTLTNRGTIRKSQDIFGPDLYYFGLAGGPINGADLNLNVTTSNFTSIQVDRIDSNHPNRSGANAASGAGWGTYWSITPAGTGTVDVTLPTAFTPDANDKACRYTGTGLVWDCARTTNTLSTITREGVTTFSDWAAGNEVGPTAITLNTLEAQTTPDNSAMGWLLMLLGVFTLGGLWLMRKAARD